MTRWLLTVLRLFRCSHDEMLRHRDAKGNYWFKCGCGHMERVIK